MRSEIKNFFKRGAWVKVKRSKAKRKNKKIIGVKKGIQDQGRTKWNKTF